MRVIRVITVALFAAMFLLVSHLQGTAQAYLDPGTGSIALQFLLAAVVGVLATVRLYWDRMKAFFYQKHIKRDVSQGT
jgi:hypothetical protein